MGCFGPRFLEITSTLRLDSEAWTVSCFSKIDAVILKGLCYCLVPGIQEPDMVLHLESKHQILFCTWNPSTKYCSAPGIPTSNIVLHLESEHQILFCTWNPSTKYCSAPGIPVSNIVLCLESHHKILIGSRIGKMG